VIVISNHGIVGEGMPDETINQDILDRIYHNTCSVCSNSGVPMVMPKKVALRMENY
jgi:iron complex transport system ATP-binding protein